MKRSETCLLISITLAICFLAACVPGGTDFYRMHCSQGGEICVKLDTVQSFRASDPVELTITVTSTKDLPILHTSLHTGSEISVDGPQTWENFITNPFIDRGYAYWSFSINKGQSLTFKRVLHFPPHEGYFQIIIEIANIGRTINATDSFYAVISESEGQIIFEGTPIPKITPHITSAVYGPGTPVPTFITEPTRSWEATLTLTRSISLENSATPVLLYPPPVATQTILPYP